MEAKVRAAEAEGRVQVIEGNLTEVEEKAREAEGRARGAEQRAGEADHRARVAEERVRQAERQWVVERREVHITEEVLGGGGWGEVKVAEFRGIKVSVQETKSFCKFIFFFASLYPWINYDGYNS